jgi:hypothetical protein
MISSSTFRLALALALALASGPRVAQAAGDPAAVLAELAKVQAEVRANPAKARTAKCPADVNALAGLPLGQVLIELGQPDASSSNSISYSLVTFRFDGSGKINAVECRPAK